jgi:pimeloyl-ACP methyl ester carboxylesterase
MTPDAPVVLVPGMLCDADLWSGIRTAAPLSGAVPVAITEPSIADMAEQVLDAVDGPFTLVGLSLGAIVGFEVLRRAPDRVLGLAAVATNPAAPRAEQHTAWQAMRDRTAGGGFADVVREQLLPTMFATPDPPPEHAGRFLAMAHRVGPEVFAAQLTAQATRTDALGHLAATRCPVLAVCGDRDALCPVEYHRAIAAAAPAGRLHVLPGAGHLLPIAQPHAFSALLHRWLRAQQPVTS